jgi:hypothetical protein
MASTHIPYLKMKMPGPRGTITIAGDYKRSLECAKTGSCLAEAMVVAKEREQMHKAVALAQAASIAIPGMSNPHGAVAFSPPKETKKIVLDAAMPERTITIGTGLSDK